MSAIHRTAAWGSFTRKVRPIIEATLPAPCINPDAKCPGLVAPDDQWDVGHVVSHHLDPSQPLTVSSVGPAHRPCNRRAGAREGRAKQVKTKREDQKLPPADSGW